MESKIHLCQRLFLPKKSEKCKILFCPFFFVQLDLFENIKPLFANKPLFVVANKTDVRKIADLKAEDQVSKGGTTINWLLWTIIDFKELA